MSEWEKLVPRPRSAFLQVKCPDCGNEQRVFSCASTRVYCSVCNSLLAEPTGGKAKILGEVTNAFP
ncbi:MAG: 30S ribosomal protein S27e [Candidatus Brockarchaeota archaeon]|nr:30S ribosomal protein S27e [Candidatus Brockarchaeota archaeon]